MDERRKAVLGRVVPGVTPSAQRQLQRVFAVLQRLSPRLAGWIALQLFLTPARRRVEPVDAPILATANRQSLRAGDHRFVAWQWGTQPPWVILLHGWGSHAARFSGFVAPLRAAGFSVIGIDAPGHGHSPGRQSDLLKFRDCLAEVLRAHAPVHGVIGHSLGGGALLTTLAESRGHKPLRICLFGVPSHLDYILESFALMLSLREPARAALRRSFQRRFGRTARAVSMTDAARAVDVPVLVVHDEQDTVAPVAQGQSLADALPRATLVLTQGFGHSGALRDPVTIQRVVEFLRAADRPESP